MTLNTDKIDEALSNGDIGLYEKLTGKYFEYTQIVVHGDKRGRKIGFPTINQQLPDELKKPKFGVYATIVTIADRQYFGITNIGIRPTFNLTSPNSETYVMDFSGDLYDKEITVRLVSFLRPERKFDGLDDLQKQLKTDMTNALSMLNKYKL